MALYQRENGHHTTQDDPKRLIWYGLCGFWTDNWESLASGGTIDQPGHRIPVCPHCKCVGFQITLNKWLESAKIFEEGKHPRYAEWVNSMKDAKCTGALPALIKKYEMWLKAQESQKT